MADPTQPVRLDPLRPLALELRHLRLVVAIEEEGGVTRAGEPSPPSCGGEDSPPSAWARAG